MPGGLLRERDPTQVLGGYQRRVGFPFTNLPAILPIGSTRQVFHHLAQGGALFTQFRKPL